MQHIRGSTRMRYINLLLLTYLLTCAIGNIGNPKSVGMSENHSVESGVPPKTRFGSQGATPRPDSKYAESSSCCYYYFPFLLYHPLFQKLHHLRPGPHKSSKKNLWRLLAQDFVYRPLFTLSITICVKH